MTRDEALADLAASMETGEHGSLHIIDGAEVHAVRRSLTVEEAQAFAAGAYAADGLLVEGFRLTAEAAKLPYAPVVGGRMVVDGSKYEVKAVLQIGIMRRITCVRYLS